MNNPLERYAWLSVGAALATISLKLLAWWVTDSVGLLSDALESFVNLAAALFALSMLRLSAMPADAAHPYGRSKAEYFASGAEGALIMLAAAAIIWSALPRLVEPQVIVLPFAGIALTVLASIINLVVARRLLRAAREHHSVALEADAHHLMTDVWTSAGVVAGVTLVALTGWSRLDPLLALAVAAHILWIGGKLMRRSVAGLLDAAIAGDEQNDVTKIFAEYAKRYGVAFHALRTRRAGTRRFVSFHLLVPDEWTVAHAHGLSEEIEQRIRDLVPNATTFCHIEPISHPSSYDDMELDR
ncbi:MAG: cation diffusion facilitator family transporter [Proteobacteria bacterium]|nr:cation diffusion facilitator family transporter [Pseudomonadota bacterium]